MSPISCPSFSTVYSTFDVTNITTTEYYLQTNDCAKRFNSTMILQLYHYVSEHPVDSNLYRVL